MFNIKYPIISLRIMYRQLHGLILENSSYSMVTLCKSKSVITGNNSTGKKISKFNFREVLDLD
jgi:hypothetical protein